MATEERVLMVYFNEPEAATQLRDLINDALTAGIFPQGWDVLAQATGVVVEKPVEEDDAFEDTSWEPEATEVEWEDDNDGGDDYDDDDMVDEDSNPANW